MNLEIILNVRAELFNHNKPDGCRVETFHALDKVRKLSVCGSCVLAVLFLDG